MDKDKVYRVRDYDTGEPAVYVYVDDDFGWVYIMRGIVYGDAICEKFVADHVRAG